jgi:hypothetical protein
MINIIGGSLDQWEKGRKVKIECEEAFSEVHFSHMGDSEALVVEANENIASIPNILLQSDRQICVYVVQKEGDAERTLCSKKFSVSTRPKPSDYVYTEIEIKNFDALLKRFGDLEERISAIEKGVSSARIGEVVLQSDRWVGEESPYSQIVTIDGVTENSQVDLTPDAEQLEIFRQKELTFTTKNVGGIVTVYAVGQKPANDYTIQVTITEVRYG